MRPPRKRGHWLDGGIRLGCVRVARGCGWWVVGVGLALAADSVDGQRLSVAVEEGHGPAARQHRRGRAASVSAGSAGDGAVIHRLRGRGRVHSTAGASAPLHQHCRRRDGARARRQQGRCEELSQRLGPERASDGRSAGRYVRSSVKQHRKQYLVTWGRRPRILLVVVPVPTAVYRPLRRRSAVRPPTR